MSEHCGARRTPQRLSLSPGGGSASVAMSLSPSRNVLVARRMALQAHPERASEWARAFQIAIPVQKYAGQPDVAFMAAQVHVRTRTVLL